MSFPRGEFKRLIESLTDNANIDPINRVMAVEISAQDVLVRTKVPAVLHELHERMVLEAIKGEKWAHITTKASLDEPRARSNQYDTMIRVSGSVQEEGFQTDEATADINGFHLHQLTVFWDDGKQEYEAQHRLGTVDYIYLMDGLPAQ